MKLEEMLKKKENIKMEEIDSYDCRIMGTVKTYDITLLDKDFKYTKSILRKQHGGSCVLPFDKDGNIFLEIQYRFPLRKTILELPAGKNEDGESFLECAIRELKEETGCTSENIIEIPQIFAQPDFTDEKIGCFIALNCNVSEEQSLDVDETVIVEKIPLEVVAELVRRNSISDERTIIVLGYAYFVYDFKFLQITENIGEYASKVEAKIVEQESFLEEKDVGIDYMETCEFGLIKDHIVKVPGNKNSRRECFYLKASDIVLPISKNGKIGILVRYLPSIEESIVQLPCKIEFEKGTNFEAFGELATTIGHSNEIKYMFLAKELEENDEYIWFSKEEIIGLIKDGYISDGKVLAIIFKYLLS